MSVAPYCNKRQFIEWYGEREKDKYVPYVYFNFGINMCVV